MSPDLVSFAEVVLQKIKTELDNGCNDVASNRAKDYPEYRWMCGRLYGLAQAEGIIKDLLKSAEESDG